MKSVVVCLDGTWNAPEARLDDNPANTYMTNVYKVWESLTSIRLEHQNEVSATAPFENGHVIYVRGVGTDGPLMQERFDGALGTGIGLRLATAYKRLSDVYSPGDEIFIFGFSRGAFTALSLACLLDHSGVEPNATDERLAFLIHNYFMNTAAGTSVPVKYLGLWDAVSAVSNLEPNARAHKFQPKNVGRIRHALALDEGRSQFTPISLHANATTTEAWFIGAHSNIGGGYRDQNLSNIAFFWVLAEAGMLGLQHAAFNEIDVHAEEFRNPIDSYREFWSAPIFGTFVQLFNGFSIRRSVRPHQSIHASVLEALGGNYKPRAVLENGLEISESYVKEHIAPWSEL